MPAEFCVKVVPPKCITGVPVKLSFTNSNTLVLPVVLCDNLYVCNPVATLDLDILALNPEYNPGAYIEEAADVASPVLSNPLKSNSSTTTND